MIAYITSLLKTKGQTCIYAVHWSSARCIQKHNCNGCQQILCWECSNVSYNGCSKEKVQFELAMNLGASCLNRSSSHPFSWYPTFRRQVSQIQPSDVIITNIRNNAQGELEFVMYIQVEEGNRVLAIEPLESAVQVNIVLYRFRILLPSGILQAWQHLRRNPRKETVYFNSLQSGTSDYMNAGFTVTFVRVIPTTESPTASEGLSTGQIAGIAIGSVFGVLLLLLLLIVFILLW